MKIYSKFISICICCLIYIIISCDKYPTESSLPYGATILSSNLKIIDNMRGIDLSKIDPSHTDYTFETTNYYSDSIEVGDIIIGTEFGGFIRRVIRVTIYPNQLLLRTEYATLGDAIVNGGLDTTVQLLTSTQVKKNSYNFELISAPKGVSVSQQGIDISGLSLYSGKTDGVDVEVEIVDGFISFDPKLEYGFAMNSKGLDQFHTFVSGELTCDYDMVISSNGKFGMTGLKTIAEFQYSSVQMFGPLPILESITLKYDIGFIITATNDGLFSYGTKATYDVKAGGRLLNNKWTEVWTANSAFESKPISWPGRGEMHIKTFIRPRISVSFYSVPGSQISFLAFTNFDATVNNYPAWCWELNNGIEAVYGFQLLQFGHEIPNYSQNLTQIQWPIDSACENIEDITAPTIINDLTGALPTPNSVKLLWTSTGDDAETGKASEYDIRYLKSPIDLTNWSLATQCSPTPNPQSAGLVEEYIVTGLSPNTEYYFALRVADEVPNWSPLSNVAVYTTSEVVDVIHPSAVRDLFAGSPTENSITLTWTAPGDDDFRGTADNYDIRVSTDYIVNNEWETYVACPNAPVPSLSGSAQEYVVTNLVPNTIYYFALKSRDEVYNWSGMSNMAGAMTTAESGRGEIVNRISSPVNSYTLDLAGTSSSLWVIDHFDDTVYNINSSDGTLIDHFVFTPNDWSYLQGIAFDGTDLWLATRSDIYKVNPNNKSILGQFKYNKTIALVTGLAWGDGKLWLAGPLIDKAYEIDVDRALLAGEADSSVTNIITFAEPSLFRGLMYYNGGLFISSWTNTKEATVYEYDPSSGLVKQQFQVRDYNPNQYNPIQGGLTTDGTYFYTGGDNLKILKIKY